MATTKFPHYVVPAYPALALLTGCFVDRWTRDADIYGRLARNAAWLTLAAAGLGVMIVVPLVARIYLPGEQLLGLVGLPLIVGAAACVFFSERRQIGRVLASLTTATVCFSLGLFAVDAVQIDRHQNTAPFAESIRRHSAPGRVHIGTFHYFRPGLVYHCNDRVEQLADSHAAREFLESPPGRSFLVTTEAEYEQIAAELSDQVGVIERSPWFLKSGQTLVLLGKLGTGKSSGTATAAARDREEPGADLGRNQRR